MKKRSSQQNTFQVWYMLHTSLFMKVRMRKKHANVYWWGRKLFKRPDSPCLNTSQKNAANLSYKRKTAPFYWHFWKIFMNFSRKAKKHKSYTVTARTWEVRQVLLKSVVLIWVSSTAVWIKTSMCIWFPDVLFSMFTWTSVGKESLEGGVTAQKSTGEKGGKGKEQQDKNIWSWKGWWE